jgi:hypothetical protein
VGWPVPGTRGGRGALAGGRREDRPACGAVPLPGRQGLHDRIRAVATREVAAWRDHLAEAGQTRRDGTVAAMAAATVNNHPAHLPAMFTWTGVHAPEGLLPHGEPTKGVEPLRLPALEPRALSDAQVRTVKNVLDRIESFHRLTVKMYMVMLPGV